MRDRDIDGRLQVTAALSLLDCSRLVEWKRESDQFVAVSREVFEYSWRRDVDPLFGRLVCWIIFSSGAELLAKGVCLIRGIEIRKPQQVPAHPHGADLQSWASQFQKDSTFGGMVEATHFRTLGYLLSKGKPPSSSILQRLCSKAKATQEQEDLVLASYELLRETIRNRDAHAYVPNVRDDHYFLVPELFSRCFNLLVSWVPDGPQRVGQWKDEARQFIASL